MKTRVDSGYESQLWNVLEKEKLSNLSQFHQAGLDDEVPLYSRNAQVAFLRGLSEDRANEIVLRFAVNFLRSVLSYRNRQSPYFAAITVSEPDKGELIVPSLFVWSADIRLLHERLKLRRVKTRFGKKVRKWIRQPSDFDMMEAVEDSTMLPEYLRVFVAPMQPAYPWHVPLFIFMDGSR